MLWPSSQAFPRPILFRLLTDFPIRVFRKVFNMFVLVSGSIPRTIACISFATIVKCNLIIFFMKCYQTLKWGILDFLLSIWVFPKWYLMLFLVMLVFQLEAFVVLLLVPLVLENDIYRKRDEFTCCRRTNLFIASCNTFTCHLPQILIIYIKKE